jgi:hypothetical protein
MAVLKIIWRALLGSLAVYVIVGRLVVPNLTFPLSGETFRMLRTALYALGFVTLIAAGYVRRLMLAARGPSASPSVRSCIITLSRTETRRGVGAWHGVGHDAPCPCANYLALLYNPTSSAFSRMCPCKERSTSLLLNPSFRSSIASRAYIL